MPLHYKSTVSIIEVLRAYEEGIANVATAVNSLPDIKMAMKKYDCCTE